MTPENFSGTTLAWFAAIAVVIQAPVTMFLWGKIKVGLAELGGKHDANTTMIDANTARLDRQGETQKTLLLATPVPALPDTPTTPPQAPVTASAGFQGITTTPAPEGVNQSVVVDRATMTAAHAAMGEALAGGDTDTPPPPIERYVDRPTNPATVTPLSQE